MSKQRNSVNPLTVIAVGVAAAVVLVTWEMIELLRWPVVIAAWSGVLLGVLWGAVGLWRFLTTANENEERLQAENERVRAEAAEIRRRSEVTAIVADAGQQVYLSDTAGHHWRAGHIDPRRYGNGPGGPAPTPEEAAAWLAWLQGHATAKSSGVAVEAPAQLEAGEELPPLLPRLVQAQRLIIAGGSDAGKTTLVKWLIAGRANHSQIICIDPHAPSKVLGYDVIGAGRDYEAIGEALKSLNWLLTTRYNDVRDGVLGYGQHRRISVFVDEWTSICQQVEDAGEQLQTLITESRKVNIHLTICSHSTTVDALGIDAQIRKSATIVELTGGNGQPRRAFIHPASKTTPDGKRATPTEFALPGPFAGYPEPAGQVVLELPNAAILKAQAMEADGESITAIAREYYGVKRPNGTQTKEIRELLDRAKRATNAR